MFPEVRQKQIKNVLYDIWMTIFKVMFLKMKDTPPYVIYTALHLLSFSAVFMKVLNNIRTTLGLLNN